MVGLSWRGRYLSAWMGPGHNATCSPEAIIILIYIIEFPLKRPCSSPLNPEHPPCRHRRRRQQLPLLLPASSLSPFLVASICRVNHVFFLSLSPSCHAPGYLAVASPAVRPAAGLRPGIFPGGALEPRVAAPGSPGRDRADLPQLGSLSAAVPRSHRAAQLPEGPLSAVVSFTDVIIHEDML
ncbi:hypothetical protein GOODEAATRI_007875 [Goodea atripinnis]|uniref:Uncharacterized protein n=1 Tax=Goodea atripinnis TaxID=208336 RepID=A0ABV0PW83_9TELE